MSDVFREERVVLSRGRHVDFHELLVVPALDGQVVPGDRGSVACLWVVCLPRHRLIVTVGHEGPLSTAKA